MAYMNAQKKEKIAAALKVALADTNIKYSLRVRNHSTIVCTIRQSDIDFIGNYNTVARKTCEYRGHEFREMKRDDYIQVNHYHMDSSFDGAALEVLQKIKDALNIDNYDNSDIMTDYFDVGHHISIHIGEFEKPFALVNTAPSKKQQVADKKEVQAEIARLMAEFNITVADLA